MKITVCRYSLILLACPVLWLSGCASGPTYPQYADKVSALPAIVVASDSSVIHNRTMHPPLLDVKENEEIAARLAKFAADSLRARGYTISASMQTVGVLLESQKPVDVDFNSTNPVATGTPKEAPFSLSASGAEVTSKQTTTLYRSVIAEWMSPQATPFGTTPVLIIAARGHTISGGAVAANVGKGALNTLVVIGAAVGGGGSGNLPIMEFDKDMRGISFWLLDPVSGNLLWKDAATAKGDPDASGFSAMLEKMLKKLPAHRAAP